jgi:hypothetical protein
MKKKQMFRNKHIDSIRKIGSKVDEFENESSEISFEDEKWAKEYCESFMFNLRVDRFNKRK